MVIGLLGQRHVKVLHVSRSWPPLCHKLMAPADAIGWISARERTGRARTSVNPFQTNSTTACRESAPIATREPRYSKLRSFIVESSMTLRISALLLPALVIGPALRAQPVFHDSQAPQVSFASAEIARALGP